MLNDGSNVSDSDAECKLRQHIGFGALGSAAVALGAVLRHSLASSPEPFQGSFGYCHDSTS